MAINPQQKNEGLALLHGIPMTDDAFEQLINLESPYRYELIDGIVYDMTGSTPEHSDICSNLEFLLKEQLGRSGPCRVYREQYVFIPGYPSVIPDVVVTCDLGDRDKARRMKPFKIRSPLIVIEVLSPATSAYDRAQKFDRYRHAPTLEIYMLVSQDEKHVEVYRRSTDWDRELFSAQQTIHLDQLDLELSLEAIYEGVL